MTVVDTGLYNVQSSLFAWLYAQLVTYRPPTVTTVILRPEWPQEGVTPPMWSVVVLDIDGDSAIQGGHTGGGTHGEVRYGILQIDCWVSRRSANWVQQVAQMRDAVTRAVNVLKATGSAVIIRDFYTNPQAPATTAYRITIDRVESGNAPLDPNPDIERKRLLLFFSWVERI